MKKKNFLSKIFLITIILIALFVVPANSSLIIGYGRSTPTPTPASTSTSTSTTTSTTTSTSPPSPPTCNDQKPGSAPVLLSAIPTGANAVTLTWAKANDPVSYYLVTFGTRPGEQLYGNPNVGDSNTTSYTVTSLPAGRRFYFKVRAGNGCKPGDFSNEVNAVTTGRFIARGEVPPGFAPGVLGAKIEPTPMISPTNSPTVQASPALIPTETPAQPGFFQRLFQVILNFFQGIFGR